MNTLRTGSMYFGDGVTTTSSLAAVIGDVITVLIVIGGILVASAWYYITNETTSPELISILLDILFDIFIPLLAGLSCLVSIVLTVRACSRAAFSGTDSGTIQPGRKAAIVASSALVFAASTFYRSLNIASEGAAVCRSTPTLFNAPITGRTVATAGEIALVVQASLFIEEASRRLKTRRGVWARCCHKFTHAHFSTIIPVILAEICSWSGVLRLAGEQSSLFFCVEYVLWMIIAMTWAWDSAELLHKSQTFMDSIAFSILMLTGVVLFLFNAVLELPHFFQGAARDQSVPGVWECIQAKDSPLWKKRLPFFICYFIGASWISTAGAHRFLRMIRKKKSF